VDGTGPESCLKAGCGICGAEPRGLLQESCNIDKIL
jgi:hypothetical protein